MQCLSSNSNQSGAKIQGFKEKFSDLELDYQNLIQDRLKTSQSDSQSIDFQIGPSSFPSHEDSSLSNNMKFKIQILKFALLTIFNKSKKALNASTFQSIKIAAKKSQQNQISIQDYELFPSEQINIHSFVQKTLSYGNILQNNSQTSLSSIKQLYRRIFYLEAQNSSQAKKIDELVNEIDEKEKTLLKQSQKKRESLETFLQEIKQKNDFIFQLKNSIKQYQKMLGINHQRLSVQNVLIEDQLELKRNCLRLQNINERLNNDLKSSLQKIEILKNEVQQLKDSVLVLKTQNQKLKQKNFDLTHFLQRNLETGEIYTSLCKKLNKKIDSMKLQQKNSQKSIPLNKYKNSDIFSSGDLFSSKKTQTSLSSIPLSRKSSLKDLQTEQKIQEIFSFIFNIQKENYELNNQELFDQDELKLLKSHKNFFLLNTHNQNPQITQQKDIQSLKNPNIKSNEVIYLQVNKNKKLIENSFFDILESQTETFLPSIKQLQEENLRLIQKISGLKKMHMHTRQLLLNLFKTIDFTNIKNQTLKILEIIFDFFQYSQDQRSLLIKQKRKKFWGII